MFVAARFSRGRRDFIAMTALLCFQTGRWEIMMFVCLVTMASSLVVGLVRKTGSRVGGDVYRVIEWLFCVLRI